MTAEPDFDREPRRPVGPPTPPREPAFHVPGVVLVSIAALGLIHFLRTQVLGQQFDLELLVNLSFVTACYTEGGGLCTYRNALADIWSPLTHALLHGSWTHLLTNAIWFVAFGTPIARRFGIGRFLGFCAFGALAGAGMFFLFEPRLMAPMIGASGMVSALMGGASRFALGPLNRMTGRDVAYAARLSIRRAVSDRTVLFFVIVFFATNLLFGSGVVIPGSGGGQVAWEAHVGGFLFGFLAFAFFDPQRPPRDRRSSVVPLSR